MQLVSQCLKKDFDNALQEVLHAAMIFMQLATIGDRGSLLRRGFNGLYMALYMTLTVLNRCVENAQAKKAQSQTSARSRSKKC
jgi:hypothetical protein